MPAVPQETQVYLRKTSPRFQAVYEHVDQSVRRRFRKAEPVFAYKMPGWRIPIPKASVPPGYTGTIDPTAVSVCLVERKGGITLHLWNPRDFYGLEAKQKELSEAGFKVMRGCIQFNRKSDYPIAAVDELLKGVAATTGA